jgi:hypothetical protein
MYLYFGPSVLNKRSLLWYAECNSAFELPIGLSHVDSTGSPKLDDVAAKFILIYLSSVLLSRQELSRKMLGFILLKLWLKFA